MNEGVIQIYEGGDDEVQCTICGDASELFAFANRNIHKMFLLVSCDMTEVAPGNSTKMVIKFRGEPGYLTFQQANEQIAEK